MRRFLLIGGSGFIGRHISGLLALDEHVHVTIADRKQPVIAPANAASTVYLKTESALPDQELLEAIARSDVIVYLASTTIPSTSNENPRFDIESNLVPLVMCLDELKKHRGKKLVYASSGGTIYGPNDLRQQAEGSPTNPICSYGIVKLAAEKYLHMYSSLHGVSALSLRIANPYGVEQLARTMQGAIGVFISKILKHETIEIWGDGSIARDYIWIDDVARAFLMASDYTGQHSCFNIGTGRATTLSEIIELIERRLQMKAHVDYRSSRSLDVALSALNCQLAHEELNWRPTMSLEAGIQRMCDEALTLNSAKTRTTG